MRKLKKFVVVVCVSLMFAMVVSGCGGSSAPDPEPTPPPAAPAPAEPTPTPEPEPADDAGGVDASLKQFLDTYERFIDSYIDLMERYLANTADVALLSDYMQMVDEAETLTREFESIDENSLSVEDLAYFVEVQTRVLQKMRVVEDLVNEVTTAMLG
ncbi:MAG: hypothetical protein FWH32_03200 [Clostridiales bacterium]|nr:hypothetical protein [Clostridiales bacterium]